MCDDQDQYRLLKQYAGSKYATVNKKYLPPYEVDNNMNIITLSNSKMSVYVSKMERATSVENNQFFVYNFRGFPGAIDPDMDEKLEARIGHYVRTELKAVFDKIDFNGNRYSIKVPITDEEKGLFESNATEEETYVEKLIDKIADEYEEKASEYSAFVRANVIPRGMIEDISYNGPSVQKIIKQMREMGYITMDPAEKKQHPGKRIGVYRMTPKLIAELKKNVKKTWPLSGRSVRTVSARLSGTGHYFWRIRCTFINMSLVSSVFIYSNKENRIIERG